MLLHFAVLQLGVTVMAKAFSCDYYFVELYYGGEFLKFLCHYFIIFCQRVKKKNIKRI